MNTAPRFNGRSAREAKRRALNYWFANRDELGLSLSEFFNRCRVSAALGNTSITFYKEGRAVGERISAA